MFKMQLVQNSNAFKITKIKKRGFHLKKFRSIWKLKSKTFKWDAKLDEMALKVGKSPIKTSFLDFKYLLFVFLMFWVFRIAEFVSKYSLVYLLFPMYTLSVKLFEFSSFLIKELGAKKGAFEVSWGYPFRKSTFASR